MIETEQHFTPKQVAELWQVHPRTVRRLFADQPGVLATGGTRKTLRIPASVLQRVHANRSQGWTPAKVQRGGRRKGGEL